ncbi:hypothetical protein J1614_009752 [Plenodomus biglobosus]|nr:hypothetical protein J1614_009752 [Plenodomus biglobosus]
MDVPSGGTSIMHTCCVAHWVWVNKHDTRRRSRGQRQAGIHTAGQHFTLHNKTSSCPSEKAVQPANRPHSPSKVPAQ